MDAANEEENAILLGAYAIMLQVNNMLSVLELLLEILMRSCRKRKRSITSTYDRHCIRQLTLNRKLFDSDDTCLETVRMDRAAFYKLCYMLQTTGRLVLTRGVDLEEMVGSFLYILSHNAKNRMVRTDFARSGETVSRHFQSVLNAVLRLHKELLKKPEPVPQNSTDLRWKWFKNCLGALDGTLIKVIVSENDKPRYRSRKGDIATNVLGVCSSDLQFIYILPGWEGSASDSRVLRDAISRPNGFKVPAGHYYLCDAGYANAEGFLVPYRGQRYHLSEWRENLHPQTKEEFFNYKHASARNVIERCFGLLKMRWAILRDRSWYPIKTHCRIISACALIHNHIRREMSTDPLERALDSNNDELDPLANAPRIQYIETSNAWTAFRDNLAQEMWNEWQASRHH